MSNTHILRFKAFCDDYGSLTSIESNENIPFNIERIYYIYDVPKHVRRGFHAHRHLQQILICLTGSVCILTDDHGVVNETILDDPTIGLYIGPMVWREMYNFSQGCVLLVIASEHYNEDDYIRNYNQYKMHLQQINI